MIRRRGTRDLAVLTAGLTATIAVAVVFRWLQDITPTTVGLALLLVVLLTATFARMVIATTVAVVATAAFNFFFFPPVGTLTISDPQNWVAVLAFLVAAVIGSHLSAAAQSRAHDAIGRRNEVTRLFELTRDVLLTTEAAGANDSLARHVARRFELTHVAICLPDDHGWRVHQGGTEALYVETDVLDAALARARGTAESDAGPGEYGDHTRAADAGGQLLILPLRHGTRAIGLLTIAAPAVDLATLDAVAGVVAIAVERTRFLSEREAAELVSRKAELAATLLAAISHDLKTPLTAIRAAVENLRDERAAHERRDQAGAAIIELERLDRLFQDILEMARIDAAAVPVGREWVTPDVVVDAAAAHVRHALHGHALQVDADASVEVEIDPRIASVALSHLLENAAHYSPAGRHILVEARATAEGLRVTVIDEGFGLDASELEHLFDRFYRGRTARRLVSGTGMGLAITRGLLAATGGRVSAENAPGAGARFTIIIPGPNRPAAVTA